MIWQPQEDGLRQVIEFLKLSQSPNTASQNLVHKQLKELNESPEISNYYAYVLTKCQGEDEATRSLCGLVLKNHLRTNYSNIRPDVLEYVKQLCLEGLNDQSQLVRASLGIVVSAIITRGGITAWPQLLPQLCNMMDSSDYNVCEGALNTLEKICEESNELHGLDGNDSPLFTLIPKFITFFRHSNSKLRCHAISCVNYFICSRNKIFTFHIEPFMEGLFAVANDRDKEVCKHVCRSLSLLLDLKLDRLIPHMDSIIEYMILRTEDSDDMLAFEGSEFWQYLGESQICRDVLKPYLPRIIPLLVRNMKLSGIEIAVLKGDEEDAMIPDSDQDIRPRFHRAHNHYAGEDDQSDDDDYDEEQLLDSWNLRKSSAAALDTLANVFKDDMLPVILPILNETLFHADWVVKESGILALGAIAEGCFSGMVQHLSELFPFLISCMSSDRSLIRVITCWTLSRYLKWVVSDQSDFFLKPLLMQLLDRMLDNNKKVQQSACSALAKLEEESGTRLVPYLESIIRAFCYAFRLYQRKNLAVLYDAVGTLAKYVGSHLNKPTYVEMLMPNLIEKWNNTKDDVKDLYPLFECFTCVAFALKMGFIPYTALVFKRCLSLIEKVLNQQILINESSDYVEELDKEIAICALDLIGGIVRAINGHLENLAASSNLMQLLYRCMVDSLPELRQSSFTLLGDIARSSFETIRHLVAELIPMLCQNFDPQYVSVCNNAIWALGEVCTKLSAEVISPFSQVIVHQLLNVMQADNSLLIGIAAVTLCRIGYICPREVAPHLDKISKQWCLAICTTRDPIEKESSFRGMCMIIMTNPAGISNDLFLFCSAAVSLCHHIDQMPVDLRESISKIINGFKSQTSEDDWRAFINRFQSPTYNILAANYQV